MAPGPAVAVARTEPAVPPASKPLPAPHSGVAVAWRRRLAAVFPALQAAAPWVSLVRLYPEAGRAAERRCVDRHAPGQVLVFLLLRALKNRLPWLAWLWREVPGLVLLAITGRRSQ